MGSRRRKHEEIKNKNTGVFIKAPRERSTWERRYKYNIKKELNETRRSLDLSGHFNLFVSAVVNLCLRKNSVLFSDTLKTLIRSRRPLVLRRQAEIYYSAGCFGCL